MKVALVSPPCYSGEKRKRENFLLHKTMHRFAQGNPFFSNLLYTPFKKLNMLDLESYPLGLIQLATMLKKNDYNELKIFDFILKPDSLNELLHFDPDIIGFTTVTSDSLIWVDNVSKYLKEKLDCKIVMGGPHATLTPAQTLKTTVADYVLTGEADFTFTELIKYLDKKVKKLPKEGICYKKKNKIVITPPAIVKDLSKIPLPDLTLLNLRDYKTIHIETTRGCRFNCSFCFLSGYRINNYWRTKPIDMIIKEIKQYYNSCDMSKKNLYFTDLSNTVCKDRSIKLYKEIIKNKLSMPIYTSIDTFTDIETLSYMKKAGVYNVYVGLETGSENFMKRFPKLGNKQRVLNFFKNLMTVGITPLVSFIIMHPDESRKEIIETYKFCKKIADIPISKPYRGGHANFIPHLMKPYPNTPLYYNLVKLGWKPPETFREWGILTGDIFNYNYNELNFTRDVTMEYLLKILTKFTLLNFKSFVMPRALYEIKKGFIGEPWRKELNEL